ncbi:uncharacterized protein LOC119393412 isoform X3 [Rhipicephalus sanguineus]|uniref:uncharacterized protein LOC119393412 isoform X3 n=1 Tax=Rhipicephalus sanguineus TaxID=34632 RepID=UPI0020C2363A|nr:uncharacterized protein LOC119393412 isoform X3 [Rhipicephalus sanguineus]
MAFDNDQFAVVSFPDEKDSLAIVHKSWLNGNQDRTLWPCEKNPSKRCRMTVEGAKPAESWIEVRCLVRCWADTYKKAQEDLEALQYSSDVNNERELGRGKRQRRPVLPSDYDDEAPGSSDSVTDDEYLPPKPPTPPQRQVKAAKHSVSSSKQQHRRPRYKDAPGLTPVHTPLVRTNPQPRSQYTGSQNNSAPKPASESRNTWMQYHGEMPAPVHTPVLEDQRVRHSSVHSGAQFCPAPTAPPQPNRSQPDPQFLGDTPVCAHTPVLEDHRVRHSSVHSGAHFCPAPTAPPQPNRSQPDPQVLAFMEKILFALNAIKLTQQTHTQCFSELIKKVDDAPLHSTDIPDLPFSTVEDLLRYDEELGAKSEARVAMKKHMAIQGGESTQQKTYRILKSMLSWKVAVQFSWFGAKGKKKFSDLNICQLMCSKLYFVIEGCLTFLFLFLIVHF